MKLVRATLDGCPRYFRGAKGDNLRGATGDTELQSMYGRSSRNNVEQIAWQSTSDSDLVDVE